MTATKCPCCNEINIDAAAEGYVDFPREYHADCWTQIDAIVESLNDYDGDNIWEDIIYGVEGYDAEATAKLDPRHRSDVIAIGNVVVRYDASDRRWSVE